MVTTDLSSLWAIRKEFSPLEIAPIIEDVRALAKLHCIYFVFGHREENSIAHCVASLASKGLLFGDWISFPPPPLDSLL
ncbi:hypothetical protein LguiA_013853 [Lonicera macranthoides]